MPSRVSKLIASKPSAAAVGGAMPDIIRPSTYGLDSGQAFSMIVVFVTIVLIILIVLYIIYMIKTQNYSRQIILPHAQSLKVKNVIGYKGSNGVKSTLTDSPDSSIAFSFWLYLYRFIPKGADSDPDIIWFSSPDSSGNTSKSTQTYTGAGPGPIVFMDSRTNRVYLSFLLSYSGSAANAKQEMTAAFLKTLIPSYNNTTGDMRYDTQQPNNPYVTIPIEYFPISRWVHVACVLQSNSSSIYMDGDVYAVRSVSDLDVSSVRIERPIFYNSLHDQYYFSTITGLTPTIEAYFSSFLMYNYALNQKDIRKIYNGGPHATSFFLSRWLGLGYLYFQWPVKYVSADEVQQANEIPAV